MVFNPTEISKGWAFGGTYFRDIYSDVNEKWYRNSWKEFNELKNIGQKYYSSNYYDAKLNKYKFKTGTSLRFWENKGWIKKVYPYWWFQWCLRYFLVRRSSDDFKEIRRWKKIVIRLN